MTGIATLRRTASGLAVVLSLAAAGPTRAEPQDPARATLVELDRLLALGETTAAAALLARRAPSLERSDRLALDVIYVLLARSRHEEARQQIDGLSARLQAKSGRPASAGDRAQRSLEAEALFVQGVVAARTGARNDALRLLREADSRGFPPLDSPLMMLAGESLQALQEPALAAQAFRAILERQPGNAVARLSLGVALFTSGEGAAAEAELARVLREAPETPRVHYWLGTLLLDRKRTGEAKGHLEAEWARTPRCAPCAAKLAQVAYLTGDDIGCGEWGQRALALDSEQAEANLVLGMLANRSGRHEAAIPFLLRVIARAPGSARAHYQLALAYRRTGNQDASSRHTQIYERLLEEQRARGLGVRGAEE